MTNRFTLVVLGVSQGQEVLYRFSGKVKGTAYRALGTCVRDGCASALPARQPTEGTCAYNTTVNGVPAKVRFSLSDPSAAGGKWRWEMSVVNGSWTVLGEGQYTKRRWVPHRDIGEFIESAVARV